MGEPVKHYQESIQVDLANQCLERFLGIIGQNPSVSKSNRLHGDISQIFLIDLKYTP